MFLFGQEKFMIPSVGNDCSLREIETKREEMCGRVHDQGFSSIPVRLTASP